MNDETAAVDVHLVQTVRLGDDKVKIGVPEPVAFFRTWSSPDGDYPTKAACILRLSWRSPNRPAHKADAKQIESTGERVIRELLERGASMMQINEAINAAYLASWKKYLKGTEDVARDADFSEPEGDGSGST